MKAIIEAYNLSKKYKDHLALDQVNMTVHQGDVYGLIGRNGAGKTTLMKIINRQILASQGNLSIQGAPISQKDTSQLRIGTLIEAPGFYPNLSAYDNLKLKCKLFGIQRKNYEEELLDLVNLLDAKDRKVGNYSLGMKQRLGLALALVGDPDILLLDEPTNGMDPQGIVEFRETILRLNQDRNITVMISSHILGELYKFVNRIGIIHEGKLIKEVSKQALDIENQDHIRIMSQNIPKIISFMEEELGITDFKIVSDQEIFVYESLENPEKICHGLIKANILFDSFYLEQASLEEYFMNLTGGGGLHA